MDGLSFRGLVVVIGVINCLDFFDFVLCWFGRFDCEIYFLFFLIEDRVFIFWFYICIWNLVFLLEIFVVVVKVIFGFVGVDL